MLERDEEAHGVVFFAEGVGRFVGLHLHRYWNCHFDLHLLLVATRDVSEETHESFRFVGSSFCMNRETYLQNVRQSVVLS